MNLNQIIFITLIIAGFMTSCNRVTNENAAVDLDGAVMQTILERTSIRDFSRRPVSDDTVDELLRAAMAAPSSRDRRPWHFIVVSDRPTLDWLGTELKTAAALKSADKAILVLGDTLISDNCWFLDCSAAMQNILIAAKAKGLGAVWATVYPYDDRQAVVRERFSLPDNIMALAIVPLGYPRDGNSKPKNKFDRSRIHYNSW